MSHRIQYNGHEYPPKIIYFLLDIDNGDYASGVNYVFWFKTKDAAILHKNKQNANPHCARVIGPFKYRLDKAV
jgi:hypothetical protein